MKRGDVAALVKKLNEEVFPSLHGLPAEHVFYEERESAASLKQIQHLETHFEWFADWMNGRPRELAETLLEECVVAKNLQYFNKAPGMNQATPPHQDAYYFMLKPPVALTMWLALDEVDETNGCVRYLPGSHLHGLRSHGATQTLGFSQGLLEYGEAERSLEISSPAQPGDLLVHHALTVHRADRNAHPTRQRRALGCIFYGQSAREDHARKAAYQRRLESLWREKKLI
jgi:phytanoyl-CoA hydroxylase